MKLPATCPQLRHSGAIASVILAACFIGSLPAVLHASEFYVALDGSDTNPGTREQPFATLERGRDAIRELKKSSGSLPAGGVTVYLRGGIYPRKASFILTPEDSGTRDAPVTYTAFPGELPRLLGGVVVDTAQFQNPNAQEMEHFKKARTTNPSLHGWKIRTLNLGTITDLPEGVPGALQSYGVGGAAPQPTESELFVNGQSLVLARWPNHGELLPEALDLSRTKNWAAPHDVWVKGAHEFVWSGVTRNVAYPIDKASLPDKGFHFFNVLEEMDSLGEYYIDRTHAVTLALERGMLRL